MFLNNVISSIRNTLPIKAIVVALISIVILYGAYTYGVTSTNAIWLAEKVTQQQEQIKQQELYHQQYKWSENFIKLKAQQVNTQIEKQESIDNEIEKTIVKIIERPVYHNICLDADGLRYINGG